MSAISLTTCIINMSSSFNYLRITHFTMIHLCKILSNRNNLYYYLLTPARTRLRHYQNNSNNNKLLSSTCDKEALQLPNVPLWVLFHDHLSVRAGETSHIISQPISLLIQEESNDHSIFRLVHLEN